MNTKLDDRANLIKLVEQFDASDMKQMMAYAAGYENGKMEQNVGTKEFLFSQLKEPPQAS